MTNIKRDNRRSFSKNFSGFTLIDVIVGTAIFIVFAVGVYEGIRSIYKIVYASRMRITETAVLGELIETVRNMSYENVGISGGIPSGDLPYIRTIIRNNTSYNVTTTIRNIDDPFDGMATGTPTEDTSPADYKLVEMSITCASCPYRKPVILSTVVSPHGLEGESYNGSLFIKVFDADSQSVAGAVVSVINRSVTPNVTVTDVTDNDGYLRIIDTPTSTAGYEVIVTKSGYSTDFTTSTTAERPRPKNPNATVASRTVTELFFAIDLFATVNIHTIDQSCVAQSGRTFNIWGDKLIATEPDEAKYFRTFVSNGSGDYTLSEMEWDDYSFSATSTGYDIAGTIPMMPVNVEAGSTQDIYLLLRPHSSNSLLLNAVDHGTGLPLSGASVHLWKIGYDEVLMTGLGYVRQTDWSGGDGQVFFADDETMYFAGDSNIDINSPDGDLKLERAGHTYSTAGYLESSTFDLGEEVNFQNIIWTPSSQPVEAGDNPVRFHLATSNSSTPASWDFAGPDGTADTYFTATSTVINDGFDGHRYLRYRVYLSTEDTDYSPRVYEIAFTYTNTCLPPGQAFFDTLDIADYDYEITHSGYTTVSGTISVAGNANEWVNMASE